mgnify:CR=1 FL=1
MKKNIIITSGPTNERLDAVMKITNMSTGALGSIVADKLLETRSDDIDKLYYLSPKLAYKPRVESKKVELITIESAEDLLRELRKLLTEKKIDAVVHSAAVGDYIGEYAITAKMLANEIAEKTFESNLSSDGNIKDLMIPFLIFSALNDCRVPLFFTTSTGVTSIVS